MYFRHQVDAMRVQFLWFAAYHAKQDHCSVLLCSNNRSKGKLGITFHHFPVEKICEGKLDCKNSSICWQKLQVSDCDLRLQAKQALSEINLFMHLSMLSRWGGGGHRRGI